MEKTNALGQYLTVYHKIPAGGSPARGDFRFVYKCRCRNEKRASLAAGPFPYFLEDWMKRSFVSCKY